MRRRGRQVGGACRVAFAATALLLLPCTACQAHQHRVGGGATGLKDETSRQYYLFFGLIQLNEVNVQRMAGDLTSYSIDSRTGWTDIFLAPLLLPLTVTSRTVTVRT